MRISITLALTFIFSTLAFGQTEECEDLKKENGILKTLNADLNEKNAYFKKVLDINKPIQEVIKDGVSFKVSKVNANLHDKTMYITISTEAKEEDRKFNVTNATIVDIEGNEVKIDLYKSDIQKNLSLNTPIKINIQFPYTELDNDNPPRIIKLMRVVMNHTNTRWSGEIRGVLEFKDLDVVWK